MPCQAKSVSAIDLWADAGGNPVYYDNLSLTAGSATACSSTGFDDFQSYALDSHVIGQCGWVGWDGSTFNEVVVADPAGTARESGAQGIRQQRCRPSVLGLHQRILGILHQAVHSEHPEGYGPNKTTSLILMNKYTTRGVKGWALTLTCNLGTDQVFDAEGGDGFYPVVYDQWVNIRVEIDLEHNVRAVYYNGARIGFGPWYSTLDTTNHAKSLAAVDLWADQVNEIYYDDIAITRAAQLAQRAADDLTTHGRLEGRYLVTLGTRIRQFGQDQCRKAQRGY